MAGCSKCHGNPLLVSRRGGHHQELGAHQFSQKVLAPRWVSWVQDRLRLLYLLASYRAHGDGGVLAPAGGAAAVHLQQVLLPPPLAPQAQVLIIRPGQAGEVKLTLPQVKLHLRPVTEALVWRGRGGSSVHVDNVLGGVIVLMCITVGLSSD